ncbi:hypothetical protein PDESU_03173 [Pontiella desulfatans]|uniref:DUF5683 domain-containing protein n=1 Tax=Pontiella desulfatans TaxID=2750659 RepID=A0A6C2U3M7_PONDE|nr:hypothetical protein [Pontiella desulfatans]VGO14610.1 hypothetical protein PDESU_03173 [Pontiella desulfatans]
MKPTSRVPILLSAFACPGLGQLVQKRWVAGAVFMSGFLVGFCWVMVLALGNIAAYYSMAFDPEFKDVAVSPPATFIAPLSIAGTVYLVSLFDVFTAQQRGARKYREEQFLQEHEPSDPIRL